MPKTYSSQRSLSWPDWLKVNEMVGVGDEVRQVRYEVSSSNRKLIATYAELQREHIEATRALTDVVSSGFEQLHFDIQAISGGIAELTAVFEWGFSELLAGVGRMNDSLTELVQIAKTPAQTWAYEQFHIAQDGFRKGLYEESLEYLNRSIEGYGDNTGYKLEYRFHYLLGTIRLGSLHHPSMVDLGEAEKAFLAAARYARQDYPKEAARSFLALGWVAFVQEQILEAIKLTEQAISLNPELGEAYFQLAKILMHRGDPEKALVPLRRAIELDRNYTIKASSDDDFRAYDKQVSSLIEQLHQEAREKSTNALVFLEQEAAPLENAYVKDFSSSPYPLPRGFQGVDLNPLKNSIDNAKKAADNNTYYGYLNALSYCAQAKDILSITRPAYFRSAINLARSHLEMHGSARHARISEIQESGMGARFWLIAIGGILISFVFVIGGRVRYFFAGVVISVILGLIAWGARISSEVSNFEREHEREREREQSLLWKLESELERLQKNA